MITNIPAPDDLESSLAISVFFFQRPTKERCKRLRVRHNDQFSTGASYWRANTYSILSYDRTNFLNMMHLPF